MEEIKEELRAKALKVAYEIAADVEKFTKTKLSFDQFDVIFAKMKDLANDGYASAIKLIFYAGNEL